MGIQPLAFIGDRDPPDPLSALHARKPILGSGKPPKDLVELARTRCYLWWTIEKDNVIAGGSGFTTLAAWGRSNWPL
jgi:hypothetical protein